ncbi:MULTISPECIES: ArsR/SmtB family transcription factor [unclassified Microbacterium]|uniref:ArsR/SmtB family transcription factor n=1 Tax=unclassified Microbacterium TaxID=2609290 RepID=UPI00097E9C02|nr:metalloregulator ArsR/SmtB family transcription factor [Microbacterium sp. JB110]RCS57925.1 ArsR family transcriptional regulator [Microbacterium sp. JB110]SJM56180.1 Transcriptional regulator, ArsR family [Frigoribacterium sp. JB110]
MADIFDVIADGTRRDILRFLLSRASEPDDGTSVSQIVGELGVSQPTVSKHLKVLRENDLVHVREDGQRRFYSLAPQPLEEIDDWLVPFFVDESEIADEAVTMAVPTLSEPAVRAADSIGRAAAGARNVVQSALKRLGAS